MTWILILTTISFAIYIAYNVAALVQFGVPKSLSETYYLYGGTPRPNLKHLFTAMMVSMAMLLMPAWIDISEGNNFQFTSFIAACGIIFTGLIPEFRKSKFDGTAHTVCASTAAAAAILWILLVAKSWWILLIVFGAVVIGAVWTKTYKTALTYWLETIAFISTFSSIIYHYHWIFLG